jgi:hypothetical protein
LQFRFKKVSNPRWINMNLFNLMQSSNKHTLYLHDVLLLLFSPGSILQYMREQSLNIDWFNDLFHVQVFTHGKRLCAMGVKRRLQKQSKVFYHFIKTTCFIFTLLSLKKKRFLNSRYKIHVHCACYLLLYWTFSFWYISWKI